MDAYVLNRNFNKASLGFGDYSCSWGSHICGLYETDEERDRILFGFFNEGMKSKDKLLYCPTERSKDDFKKKFSSNFPEYSDFLSNEERINYFSARDIYFPDGVFDPIKMESRLNSLYCDCQKVGHTNIRASAEMAWALEVAPNIEDLMAYEARLNMFIPDKSWISLCLYNVNKFSGNTIIQVLKTHPLVINQGVVVENPFYQDPIDWLKENNPRYLDA